MAQTIRKDCFSYSEDRHLASRPCNVPVNKSWRQIWLERQGHVFRWQELLDNHEADPNKPCFCGRLNKKRPS